MSASHTLLPFQPASMSTAQLAAVSFLARYSGNTRTGYAAAEANRAVCVPGFHNKAIAALAKIIPDDWALAVAASQGGRFRKL